MGLIKNLKIIFYISVVVFTIVIIGCNKSTINGTNCIECLPVQPEKALLNVTVTINNENPSVPLVVYQGRFNPYNPPPIAQLDTAYSGTVSINVPTNHFYSIQAEYKSGSKIIYAIDGGEMDTQQQGACDNICWQVIGGNYDVRLK